MVEVQEGERLSGEKRRWKIHGWFCWEGGGRVLDSLPSRVTRLSIPRGVGIYVKLGILSLVWVT